MTRVFRNYHLWITQNNFNFFSIEIWKYFNEILRWFENPEIYIDEALENCFFDGKTFYSSSSYCRLEFSSEFSWWNSNENFIVSHHHHRILFAEIWDRSEKFFLFFLNLLFIVFDLRQKIHRIDVVLGIWNLNWISSFFVRFWDSISSS